MLEKSNKMTHNRGHRWEAIVLKGTHSTEHVCFMKEGPPVFVVGVANVLGDTDEKSGGCMMTDGAH